MSSVPRLPGSSLLTERQTSLLSANPQVAGAQAVLNLTVAERVAHEWLYREKEDKFALDQVCVVVMCLLANADVQRMVLVETNKYPLVSRDCRRHTRGLALYLPDKLSLGSHGRTDPRENGITTKNPDSFPSDSGFPAWQRRTLKAPQSSQAAWPTAQRHGLVIPPFPLMWTRHFIPVVL